MHMHTSSSMHTKNQDLYYVCIHDVYAYSLVVCAYHNILHTFIYNLISSKRSLYTYCTCPSYAYYAYY